MLKLKGGLLASWSDGCGDEMELLTVSEVAAMCKVSNKTVTRAIARGQLTAARLGTRGAYRLRPTDVDAWIVEQVVTPSHPAQTGPRAPKRGWLAA